ncbi:hypothetical protein BGZ99_009033 [Dissophora globulifera]|uniref:Uncharacterized protein n=1 Tax=Dissophora globulifera TaxID=979702 RepID=A0A9P6R815_9FUNG|nr:hypothetical protein BGZ99_009033 [Dissophora globulifera]
MRLGGLFFLGLVGVIATFSHAKPQRLNSAKPTRDIAAERKASTLVEVPMAVISAKRNASTLADAPWTVVTGPVNDAIEAWTYLSNLYQLLTDENLSVALVNSHCSMVTIDAETSSDGKNWNIITSFTMNGPNGDQYSAAAFKFMPNIPSRLRVFPGRSSVESQAMYVIPLTPPVPPISRSNTRTFQGYNIKINGVDDLCKSEAQFAQYLDQCQSSCGETKGHISCPTCNVAQKVCSGYSKTIITTMNQCIRSQLSPTLPFHDGNLVAFHSNNPGNKYLSECDGCDAQVLRLATSHSTLATNSYSKFKAHFMGVDSASGFPVVSFESQFTPGYYLALCAGCTNFGTVGNFQKGCLNETWCQWIVASVGGNVVLMSFYQPYKYWYLKVCNGCLGLPVNYGETAMDVLPELQVYKLWTPSVVG